MESYLSSEIRLMSGKFFITVFADHTSVRHVAEHVFGFGPWTPFFFGIGPPQYRHDFLFMPWILLDKTCDCK